MAGSGEHPQGAARQRQHSLAVRRGDCASGAEALNCGVRGRPRPHRLHHPALRRDLTGAPFSSWCIEHGSIRLSHLVCTAVRHPSCPGVRSASLQEAAAGVLILDGQISFCPGDVPTGSTGYREDWHLFHTISLSLQQRPAVKVHRVSPSSPGNAGIHLPRGCAHRLHILHSPRRAPGEQGGDSRLPGGQDGGGHLRQVGISSAMQADMVCTSVKVTVLCHALTVL